MSTLVVNSIQNDSAETPFQPTIGTAQETTSGTAFDFTGIPSWVKRITVVFTANSLTGSDNILVQLGDSGGFYTTGYVCTSIREGASSTTATSTAGFAVDGGGSAGVISGHMLLTNGYNNTWSTSHVVHRGNDTAIFGGGHTTISGTLTQIRVTRSGSDTFDAGQVNIIYE